MRALALMAAGIAYLALVLFDGMEFPLLSLVFIVLALCEWRRLHRARQRHPQRDRRSAIN
jgi:CDP-diglyceride synthetase